MPTDSGSPEAHQLWMIWRFTFTFVSFFVHVLVEFFYTNKETFFRITSLSTNWFELRTRDVYKFKQILPDALNTRNHDLLRVLMYESLLAAYWQSERISEAPEPVKNRLAYGESCREPWNNSPGNRFKPRASNIIQMKCYSYDGKSEAYRSIPQ